MIETALQIVLSVCPVEKRYIDIIGYFQLESHL